MPPSRSPGVASVPSGRPALLVGGGAALVAGLWTGLARAGLGTTPAPAAAHGVLMVLGFLGTLIALERAVAFRARWSYAGPVLAVGGTLTLLAGAPPTVAGLLFTAAGLLVALVYVATLRRHVEPYLVLMAAGSLLWVAAAALWASGRSPIQLSPLLAGFLVLTIVGERLELSRLRAPTAAAQRPLLLAAGLFLGGVVLTQVDRPTGLAVAGLGLVAQTVWLWRNDISRVTIHRPGLPRFAAACMLSGYVWLAAAGLLWLAQAARVGGHLVHDAALHAIFLGFAISMVMGHAPIILPAVLSTPLPHDRTAWVPLAVLHTSLATRVIADVAGADPLRAAAAIGNVAALVLFVVLGAIGVVRARTAAVGRDDRGHSPPPRPTQQAPRAAQTQRR